MNYRYALVGAGIVGAFAAGYIAGHRPGATAAPAEALTRADFDQLASDFITDHGELLDHAIADHRNAQVHAKLEMARQTLAARHHDVYDDPDMPSAGAAGADVTIVEFFDYRCPYCKSSAPAIEHLLQTDPGVRVIWRDLPILGDESVYLSHLALAAGACGRYREFHAAVFAALSGHAKRDEIDRVVQSAGFDPAQLEAESHTPAIEATIQRNLDLAKAIGVNGTPAWVIGDQLIPGALTADRLAEQITDLRRHEPDPPHS